MVGWECTRMGKTINAYIILVGKSLGKFSLERLGKRWEGNIKMDLVEIICNNGDGWKWLRNMSIYRLWVLVVLMYSATRIIACLSLSSPPTQ
jgi:hypothetical protein